MSRKIVTIIGARPQFIKAAAVSRQIRELENIQEIVIHSGQHYDSNMSRVFFQELDIPEPNFNLGVQEVLHGAMTGRMLSGVEQILLAEKPEWVLVYGDTNTTLAGALAAAKLHIPVAHVEAGLRSFVRSMPEEINRVLTDHISDLLLTPTDRATSNLIQEGIVGQRVHQVGDVMYDAALFYIQKARRPKFMRELGLTESGSYILATIHRAENTDNPERLKNIIQGLSAAPFPVVLPLHPRTKRNLKQFSIETGDRLYLHEPVGFLEMVWLEKNAKVIATDSGGVQKEAYFHGVPCITLRDETEWTELVDMGVNRIAGANAKMIKELLSGAYCSHAVINDGRMYGGGTASKRICGIMAGENVC